MINVRNILLALLLMMGTLAIAGDQHMMSVQVRESQVRSTPAFLGKIVGTVRYGDRVQILDQQGGWSRVVLPKPNLEGWMHDSALTTKKIVFKAGAADVQQAATTEEIALAGKGFNRQVEEEFKAKNPNLDFTWVDRMAQTSVSQEQMQRFLEEGRLVPEGGAK